MRWFGRSTRGDKKEPLIQLVHSIGKDGATETEPTPMPAPEVGMNPPATNPEAVDIPNTVPAVGSDELDYKIPAGRVTSGEREMILPKHMKKKNDKKDDDDNSGGDNMNDAPEYLPFTEVHTQSMEDSHSTAVISAISLSTIGASIEREVEIAKKLKSQPPLEIRANMAQKAEKKVEIPIWTRFTTALTTALTNTLPNSVVDGLAAAYDKIHAPKDAKSPKSLHDVPVTARKFRRNHPDLLLPGNVPQVGFTAMFAAIPMWIKYLAVGAVTAAALTGLAVKLEGTILGEEFYDWQEEQFVDWSEEKSLAFIGNSYFFVNDIPRLMTKISQGRIHENDCINPAAGLGKMLRAGNGMYELWETDNSVTYRYNTDWNEMYEGEGVHDWGACTVFQLLEGYDNDLTYKNYNGAYYYEEGKNPCFDDQNYLLYLNDYNLKHPMVYDYVVLNDQTRRMADPDARADSVEALKYAYAPMILDSRAKPLIVDTHAYPEDAGTNETEFGDTIPYMQAMISYAVDEYLMALKYNLPSSQEPKVVPIGMAYNLVWEEDYGMWKKLFLNESMPYASPYGSYLFANVLYGVVYGHLPHRPTTQTAIKDFFASARYLPELPEDWSAIFPTVEESDYLRLVARRVALMGEIPESFKKAKEQIEKSMRNSMTDDGVEEECVCENSRDECDPEAEDYDDCLAGKTDDYGDDDAQQKGSYKYSWQQKVYGDDAYDAASGESGDCECQVQNNARKRRRQV
jgi:hypothetical protein